MQFLNKDTSVPPHSPLLREEVSPPALWQCSLFARDPPSQMSPVCSCYLEMDLLLEVSMGGLVRKPGRLLLSNFPTSNSTCGNFESGWNVGTCPVEGFMMQPPLSAATLQPQPRSSVSWFIPKLWPSSCARVTAAPRGLSEWSSKQTQEHNV